MVDTSDHDGVVKRAIAISLSALALAGAITTSVLTDASGRDSLNRAQDEKAAALAVTDSLNAERDDLAQKRADVTKSADDARTQIGSTEGLLP